jgi:hypothetical protein
MPTVELTNKELDMLQHAICIYELYAGERPYTIKEEIELINKLCEAWDEEYCDNAPLFSDLLKEVKYNHESIRLRSNCDIDNLLLIQDLQRLISYTGDNLGWQITKVMQLAESGYYHLGRKEVVVNGHKQG